MYELRPAVPQIDIFLNEPLFSQHHEDSEKREEALPKVQKAHAPQGIHGKEKSAKLIKLRLQNTSQAKRKSARHREFRKVLKACRHQVEDDRQKTDKENRPEIRMQHLPQDTDPKKRLQSKED